MFRNFPIKYQEYICAWFDLHQNGQILIWINNIKLTIMIRCTDSPKTRTRSLQEFACLNKFKIKKGPDEWGILV